MNITTSLQGISCPTCGDYALDQDGTCARCGAARVDPGDVLDCPRCFRRHLEIISPTEARALAYDADLGTPLACDGSVPIQ